jgi:hypothetical protein
MVPKIRIAVAVVRDSISMKTPSNNKRLFTDDIYHVAAVDLADKLIERMQRGLGPILLGNVPHSYSVDPILGIPVRWKA